MSETSLGPLYGLHAPMVQLSEQLGALIDAVGKESLAFAGAAYEGDAGEAWEVLPSTRTKLIDAKARVDAARDDIALIIGRRRLAS